MGIIEKDPILCFHILISLVSAKEELSNDIKEQIMAVGLRHCLTPHEINIMMSHPLSVFHFQYMQACEKQKLLDDIISNMLLDRERNLMGVVSKSLCASMASALRML